MLILEMFLTVPCNGSNHDTQNWPFGAIIWLILVLNNITIEIIHLREDSRFRNVLQSGRLKYNSRTVALWSYEGGDGTGIDNFTYVKKSCNVRRQRMTRFELFIYTYLPCQLKIS